MNDFPLLSSRYFAYFSEKLNSLKMSKEIDELMKNRPELKERVQSAGQNLDRNGGKEFKTPEYEPSSVGRNGQSRAYDPPKPSLSTTNDTPGNSKEVDQMLSDRGKAGTNEVRQELNQQQVSHTKEQDHER